MIEEWNQGYAPKMLPCDAFGDPLVHADEFGVVRQMCPSTGVFYAPPLGVTALAELLWPDSWSLLPPG